MLQDIAKESSKYIRHSSRPGSLSPKDTSIPQVVKETYDKIDQLADEKLVLAQRVVDLITRARARLDYDLSRVLIQQGEDPAAATHPSASSISSVPKRHAVQEIRESLRSAITRETTPVSGSISAPVASTNKSEFVSGSRGLKSSPLSTGRRVTVGAPIEIPSPAPSVSYPSQRSSRLATAQSRDSPMRMRRLTPSVQDDDAEGEDDIEDGGEEGADPEDKTLYCFCQKLSYGEVRVHLSILPRLVPTIDYR
jgi:chromatin modification-related protein YNG2